MPIEGATSRPCDVVVWAPTNKESLLLFESKAKSYSHGLGQVLEYAFCVEKSAPNINCAKVVALPKEPIEHVKSLLTHNNVGVWWPGQPLKPMLPTLLL